VLGESITVWPEGFDVPFRMEIEDQVISRIGVLDPSTWRGIRDLQEIAIVHGVKERVAGDEGNNISREFPFRTLVRGYEEKEYIEIWISDIGLVPDELSQTVSVIAFDVSTAYWDESSIKRKIASGWNVVLCVARNLDNAREVQDGIPGVTIIEEGIQGGFEVHRAKMIVLSDKELWGTVQLSKKRERGTYGDLLLDEINPGDYVVHEDHGIAVYAGIEAVEKDNVKMQYLELKYAHKDRLLVPLAQIRRVTKYVGAGGKMPTLTRLGGGEWRRVKNRVARAVKELAGELLRLYAVRELSQSVPLSEELADTSAFDADFPFVETEDQIRAALEIKEDIVKDRPMDRVIVGDVGFGKTEVAMRAAYSIVRSGRQVAVLAPTTVLVEQHYRVFKDRFSKHGISVDSLSRFLSSSAARDVVSRIDEGKTDIVVGTHRLLGSDIRFRNLGLVVIDEEQKFGVSQKEKLKGLRLDAHVLSLSATPIPRTLNMALSGVRDISVIATPPEGRKPIRNVVKRFSWTEVAEAISREVARGGQVYYVHNRVKSIESVRSKLSELLPDVRICIGHGQMSGDILSRTMRDFHEGLYDVLLCTTIIENGLDMPRVNTLIVDRAEMFGLSQLYQIRGRVGRSDRQAYAYFLYYGGMGSKFVKKGVLERSAEHDGAGGGMTEHEQDGQEEVVSRGVLWEDARRRLDAIAQLQELGSGFALAQRDLEIRGAGDFLGREQHGNVSAIGFNLYCRLLEEMVEVLKRTQNSG